MSWLLKVVDGPVKGAEIALIEGTRVKAGSSSACDIVLPDASLAEVAFELDVSEGMVTLITSDGTQSQLTPFEIRDFGTTAVAIGPADEPWGELVRPAPAVEPTPEPPKPAEEAPVDEREKSAGKSVLPRVLILAGVVIMVVVVLLLSYLFLPSRSPSPVKVETQTLSLEEIASRHGLKFERDGDVRILTGNLRRRAERLAIRALALASDPSCKLVLTDDQTMLQSCNDVLSVYSEGKVKAVAASNRVVWVAGRVASAEALERLLRAIDEDVRGVERVDVKGVSMNDMFMVPTPIVEHAEKTVAPVAEVATPTPTPAVEAKTAPETVKPAPISNPPSVPKLPSVQEVTGKRAGLPFEGILTKPYPCVVLRGGLRVLEGARVGTLKVVAIEAERLVLEDNGRLYEWRP